jgi:hypothetical protein
MSHPTLAEYPSDVSATLRATSPAPSARAGLPRVLVGPRRLENKSSPSGCQPNTPREGDSEVDMPQNVVGTLAWCPQRDTPGSGSGSYLWGQGAGTGHRRRPASRHSRPERTSFCSFPYAFPPLLSLCSRSFMSGSLNFKGCACATPFQHLDHLPGRGTVVHARRQVDAPLLIADWKAMNYEHEAHGRFDYRKVRAKPTIPSEDRASTYRDLDFICLLPASRKEMAERMVPIFRISPKYWRLPV